MIKSIAKRKEPIKLKIKFPVQIAIPSTGNPIVLRDTTLNILKAYRIPFANITVFFESKSKEAIYKDHLLPLTYGRLVSTGTKGTAELYNWIQQFYIPGTPIVYIKDCIQSILELQSTESLQPLRSFLALCKRGFTECEKTHATIWGVCPKISSVAPTITTDLTTIPGSLWGCINPGKSIYLTQPIREDYERSVQYFLQDGAVVRLNNIVAKECIIEHHDSSILKKACKTLKTLYPEYVEIKGVHQTILHLHSPTESKVD
jgi:hypothetical protein